MIASTQNIFLEQTTNDHHANKWSRSHVLNYFIDRLVTTVRVFVMNPPYIYQHIAELHWYKNIALYLNINDEMPYFDMWIIHALIIRYTGGRCIEIWTKQMRCLIPKHHSLTYDSIKLRRTSKKIWHMEEVQCNTLRAIKYEIDE